MRKALAMTFNRWIRGEKAMGAFGASLAHRLKLGDLICLRGELGAGKSTLARGLIRSLTRPDEEAPSPTFTLVQHYQGPDFCIAHFDLYRLKRPDEVFELGLDDALQEGVALIEWPERLEGLIPSDRLDVEIKAPSSEPPEGRQVRLTAYGDWIGRDHFD